MPDNGKTKSNRVGINLENVVYEAMANLAEQEGLTLSELGRDLIVTQLVRLELLPDASIRRLAGVRD